MLYTLFYWFIVFIISYPLGVAALRLLLPLPFYKTDSKKLANDFGGLFCVLHSFVGLLVLSFVTNLYTMFYALSIVSTYFMAALAILLWLTNFGNGRQLFIEILKGIRISLPVFLLLVVSAGIYLMKSVSFPEIFDDGAYAMPLVKMYEWHQGPVLGFANLNAHNGLNSTWHSLHAFFSHIPFESNVYALNSFMALLWFWLAASLLQKGILERRADKIILIPAILMLFIFRNQLTSMSTDIPAIIGCWLVLYIMLLMQELPNQRHYLMAGIWLLPFWLLSVKLTTAALMILPLYFLNAHQDELSKLRKWIWLFLGLALLTPWFYQNYIISGYLLFPLKFTAFIPSQWQVPAVAIDEKMYSAQFGVYALPKNPDFSWLTLWWQAHPLMVKILLILAIYTIISKVVFYMPKNRSYFIQPAFVTLLIALLGWLLWFLTISEPRYGFGFFPFLAAMALATAVRILNLFTGTYLLVLGFTLVQLFNLSKTIKESGGLKNQLLVHRRPIPQIETRPIRCGNFTAQSPVSYKNLSIVEPAFCWDCPIPCLPKEESGDSAWVFQFTRKGKTGFYSKQPAR